MTTYKEGPIYAEVLHNMLDVANKTRSEDLMSTVLKHVSWVYKGGDMVEAMKPRVCDSSKTYFVDCSTKDLLQVIEARKVDRPMHTFYRDYVSLMEILGNRKEAIPMDKRTMYVRLGTIYGCFFTDDGDEIDKRMMTGLAGVYAVYGELMNTCKPKKLGEDMVTYIREMMVAASASSKLDVPTTVQIVRECMKLLEVTPLVMILEAREVVERILGTIVSQKCRKKSFSGGRVASDFDDLVSKEAVVAAKEMLGRGIFGADYDIFGVSYGLYYGVAKTRINGRHVLNGVSDLKRLSQMLMSTASLLVAAGAQACTGPPTERTFGKLMISRMMDAIHDMSKYITKYPPGEEVNGCKGLKKAFTVYMGIIAGPLCKEETVELRKEAMESCPADPSIVDRWTSYCTGLPAALAFNVGKVYKILPAPDSAPGGVLIDRLKITSKPNVTNPKILREFEEVLTDQIVWGRMLAPHLPKLQLKVGVAVPAWWNRYLGGHVEDIAVTNLRNTVVWENTVPMQQRDKLNPGLWKDSGLGSDSLTLGTSIGGDPKMKNMLMRMIFDRFCPMPGDEENLVTQEWISKSDQKPESHKDPARTIFSAEITQRFKKSKMELTVGETMQNHPSFVIGAGPTKVESRIRASLDMPTMIGWVVVYYSFDVGGWSPRMPEEPQDISHGIWERMTGSNIWSQSKRVMNGATVYVNNGGYIAWYVNGVSNFEGYDGKEMTMLNVSMLGLTVKRWRARPDVIKITTQAERDSIAALLLAYIDDGMARMVLPANRVDKLFQSFKDEAKMTFSGCGFLIEPSKCFPSDRFFIFLNEAYLAGRHLIHGVRAAGQICSVAPEPHESLIEITDKITSGARGAVKAGLDAVAGIILYSFHLSLEIKKWVKGTNAVARAVWSFAPRAWGGLGVPNALQIGSSTSGHAHVESIATFQTWARLSIVAKSYYLNMMRTKLPARKPLQILLNPFSARVKSGYMIDSRVPEAVRVAMEHLKTRNKLGSLPMQFLQFGNKQNFENFANAVVTTEPGSVFQAQVLRDLAKSHPHSIFSMFTRRIEKGSTVKSIVGKKVMKKIVKDNRSDVRVSYGTLVARISRIVE